MAIAAAKEFLRFLLKTMKWCFIVFCLFILSLLFRDQRIPAGWVVSAVSSALPTNMVFSCDYAAFGLRRGVRVEGIRLYDRGRSDPLQPVVSAESVSVDFILRSVKAVELKIPRLHDGYYLPGNMERNERVEAELPQIPSFTLTLVRPEILGVSPARVQTIVKVGRRSVEAEDIRLLWPDLDRRMSLDGSACVDFEQQRVYGEVHGDARQAHIRPMMVALDLPVVIPYMDAFTGVTEPVRAACSWDVNLVNADFKLHLDLHPKLGRYNNVPMRQVDGVIDVYSYTRGTNLNYVTTVGPLVASDNRGRVLDGWLSVRGTNNVVNVHFDAKSSLEKDDLIPIIDYLNDGELDCVKCVTPPEVTVSGVLATDEKRQEDNDLAGTVSFARGRFFEMQVDDVSMDYTYKGDTVTFSNVRAKGEDGGLYTGTAALHFPGFDPDRATFDIDIDCRNGSITEIASALATDFGGRHGIVNGSVKLSGPISTNCYSRLNGSGRISIDDERISQMKLFMGLTEYLAKNVPGVAELVNQSKASADFKIVNGVISSNNIYIEGDVFTIKAWGSYDVVKDNLDLTVRLQLMRNDTFVSKLVRPITFPFTKLLMEFRVEGSADEPNWRYISVLDRIL